MKLASFYYSERLVTSIQQTILKILWQFYSILVFFTRALQLYVLSFKTKTSAQFSFLKVGREH